MTPYGKFVDLDPESFDDDAFCRAVATLLEPIMPFVLIGLAMRVQVRRAIQSAYEAYADAWQEYEATGNPEAHADARRWYARYLRAKRILEANE